MTAARSDLMALAASYAERQQKLHDLLETIREKIRLGIPADQRPEGLFRDIQDAVYAMRGRPDIPAALRLAASQPDHKPTSNMDVAEALTQACEYFENHADVVDGDYGVPEPNTEMRLAQMCSEALSLLSGAGTKSDGDIDRSKMATALKSCRNSGCCHAIQALEILGPSDPSPGPDVRRRVLDILNAVAPAVENLAGHQEQCDMDGVMVKVSRQALDEVLNAVNEVALVSALTRPLGGFVQGSIARKQSPSSTSATATGTDGGDAERERRAGGIDQDFRAINESSAPQANICDKQMVERVRELAKEFGEDDDGSFLLAVANALEAAFKGSKL